MSHVVILLGINDIGVGGLAPDQAVSVDQISDGLSTLIAAANADGLSVLLGTLLPLQGTMAPYYSEEAEAKRQAVNTWIRASADVARVIDFDAAMGDVANPLLLRPSFDSGDHLHPNDAGYEAMAATVAEHWPE